MITTLFDVSDAASLLAFESRGSLLRPNVRTLHTVVTGDYIVRVLRTTH
jgi:hypothetical protein